MAHKARPNTKKRERAKRKHPMGMYKASAEKKLKELIKKQAKNIKRGRKGHTPVKRLIIK